MSYSSRSVEIHSFRMNFITVDATKCATIRLVAAVASCSQLSAYLI